MKTPEEILNDLFNDLQKNAYNIEYHNYYYKEANQIIRKHFEAFHKEKLREELHAFRKFYNERYQAHPDLKVADILYVDVNDYLKQKQ